MSAYANQATPYSRQLSDTQFYNKSKRVDKSTRQNGQRTVSNSEPFEQTRSESLRNHYSPNVNYRLNSDNNKRSENVVRFHKDIVTDVHEHFSDKIQVDDVDSNYFGRFERDDYATDTLELHSPTLHDGKDRTFSVNKARHSSERSRDVDDLRNHRKESQRSKETNFSVVSDKTAKCDDNSYNSGTDTNGRTNSKPNNKHLPKSQTINEEHKRRTSSKKRTATALSSSKDGRKSNSENVSSTKSAVQKTHSSSSTGSSQKSTIIKNGNGFSYNGKDPKMNLTKTNSNSSSTRNSKRAYASKMDMKLQFDNKDKLASKKRRKRCCMVLSLLVTIVIIAAMVTGAVLFIKNKETPKDALDRQRVYDIVNVHVRLRVLNQNYTSSYQNNSSPQFNMFSVQMCNEVDVIYITSHVSQNYYGCRVRSLRAGSVRVYYVSPFLDTPQTSDVSLHREILLNNLLTIFSHAHPVNTTVLGDFLVDINSIEISIERFQTTKLPQRPRMPVRVTSTVKSDSTPTSKPTTQSVGTYRVSTDAPIVSSTNVLKPTSPSIQNNTIIDINTYKVEKQTVPDGDKLVTVTTAPQFTNIHSSSSIDTTTDMDMYTDTFTSTTSIPSDENTTSGNIDLKGDKEALGDKEPEALVNEIALTTKGDNVYLQKESARVQCFINNSDNLVSLTIQHRNFRDQEVVLRTVLLPELNVRQNLSDALSSKKTLSITFGVNSILVRVDFKSVTCDDVGKYIFNVKTNAGIDIQADALLNGTAVPGMPQLSLPIALIENKEIKQPIMCTADVGFPNGQLQWKIKPKGSGEFLEFQGHFISQSGQCNNYVTNSLIYTPTKDGNGTLLKCEVVNKHVPHPPDLTAVTDLYILPESMCDGVEVNRTIRHPFTCTKYIRCLGNNFEVKECANKMCYDEESGRCGQTKLRFTDVVAYLNEGVTSLQCRLDHLGVWSNITIYKLDEQGGKDPIASVFSVTSGGNGIKIYDTIMKDRVFVHKESTQDFEMKINLWLYVLTCSDEGLYSCEAFTPSDYKVATGRIDLRGKPEAPKMSVPNEIIEGLQTRQNVTCQANVGYPEGRLVLKMKLQNETEFHPIRFNVTAEETTQNCSKIIRKSFTFTPTLLHEKAELSCEVENKFTLPVNRKLVAMEVLHVVPKNFCLDLGSSTPQVHPYDCHQYVQCSQGYTYVQRCGSDHCFNPHTLHCDIEVKEEDVPFDPKHPCLPNKNGVFFHHPILCNKYIWCVQGQEVVHHCPLGTLYIDGGQCTFEPERSRCYNKHTT